MKNALEAMIATLATVGYQAHAVDAPAGAVTFDKMMLVYKGGVLRQVHFYSSAEDRFRSVYRA